MGIRRGEITTKIVSDGLIFNFDAANRASYPRTGTTATDTIGNIAGTLSGASGDNNTPQWENVNGGIFDLNSTIGTDQTDRYIFAAPTDPTWPYYKIELTRTSATHGSGFYAIVEKFI